MPTLDEALELSRAKDARDAASFFFHLGAGTCIFASGAEGSLIATRDVLEVRIAYVDLAATVTSVRKNLALGAMCSATRRRRGWRSAILGSRLVLMWRGPWKGSVRSSGPGPWP
jgi:hypothetical protein